MRHSTSLLLLLACACGLSASGCGGPCRDAATTVDEIREKALGCPDLSGYWDNYVPDEVVAACQEPADRYCSDGDLKALSDYTTCVRGLAACEGGENAAKAFREALDGCVDKRDALSDNCRRAVF